MTTPATQSRITDPTARALLDAAEEKTPVNCYCSFCGKHHRDVEMLIVTAVAIFICSQCVEQCVFIVSDFRGQKIADAERELAQEGK